MDIGGNIFARMSGPESEHKSLRQDIELLRIVSAFGIVWFHAGRDVWGIGYGGLVVFLILSGFFSTIQSGERRSVPQILLRRGSRLLVPWAIWMVLYGIRNHFIDRNLIEIDRGWFNGLLAGTRIHLWFLPYVFAVSVALDLLVPRANLAWLGRISALASVAVLGSISLWWPWAVAHGYPTQQYCHAMAALLIGVFLACAPKVGRGWLVGLLFLLLGSVVLQIPWRGQFVGVPYLTGAGLCAWLLLKPPSLPDWLDVTPISHCTFGVYLSHVLFRDLYESIKRVPVWSEPYLTFATALLVVYLFRRFLPRPARWAV